MSINSKELIFFFSHEINQLRQKPAQFCKLLNQRLNLFKDDYTYQRSDMPTILYKTLQGKKAVKQAIQNLEKAPNLKPLILSVQLCQIAYNISLQMSEQSRVENPSNYKQPIKQAILKSQCKVQSLQLIVQYCFRKDYQVIPTILVDDGNNSRSRRQSLLDSSNRFMGLAVQEHSEYDFMVLILLTDNIVLEYEDPEQTSQCQCSLM